MLNIHQFLDILEGPKVVEMQYYVFTTDQKKAAKLARLLIKEVGISNWGERMIDNEILHFCKVKQYEKLIRAAQKILDKRNKKPARAVV